MRHVKVGFRFLVYRVSFNLFSFLVFFCFKSIFHFWDHCFTTQAFSNLTRNHQGLRIFMITLPKLQNLEFSMIKRSLPFHDQRSHRNVLYTTRKLSSSCLRKQHSHLKKVSGNIREIIEKGKENHDFGSNSPPSSAIFGSG